MREISIDTLLISLMTTNNFDLPYMESARIEIKFVTCIARSSGGKRMFTFILPTRSHFIASFGKLYITNRPIKGAKSEVRTVRRSRGPFR